ncbi:MAG: glycosyltransferase family 2 protein [Candidatus Thermoplasmatota archaeon]|nr:glycosyltransferase family 2 protein [Candidatus Thermoplasmatota archaeon]
MPHLSIVVPTYNEAENVPFLLERVQAALSSVDFELVIVDDDSPDGTARLAQELSVRYPFVRVVKRTDQRDLATAVIEGFRHSRGEVLTVMDADLQHPPEKIRDLLERIDAGADIVVGSRYVPGGEIEAWPFKRRFYSKGARAIAYLLLPRSRAVQDPMSGFFMLCRQVLDGVELHPIGYKILLEILVRGRYQRVEEVPITFRDRERGTSSLVFNEYRKYTRHLLRLSWEEGEILRFIKFGLVGGSGVLVNEGLLWLLWGVWGVMLLGASLVAVELSIIWNFIWNEVWTFRDRGEDGIRAFFKRMGQFNLVSLVGLGLNVSILLLLHHLFGVYPLTANIVGIAVAFTWNFAANNLWTWFR